MAGHVVAMGGGGFLAGDSTSPLDDLLLELNKRELAEVKRQLEQIVPVPAAVDEMTFTQVVRASAEAGLVADVSRFHDYREARNRADD